MSRQLLLIGGGHAHLGVLGALTGRRRSGVDVTLVSSHEKLLYSGMLPGLLAGHYTIDECSIPLDPVADAAQAEFVRATITGLDLAQQVAITERGVPIPFDLLSIDIGPTAERRMIPGLEHAIPVRPFETLLDAWRKLESRFAGTPLTQTVVAIGGGAAGVEVITALAHRARNANVQIKATLVTGAAGLLPGFPKATRRIMRRRLTALNVRAVEADVQTVRKDSVLIRGAGDYFADLIVAALPAAAVAWPAESGLKCDSRGFIEVNACLQSVSHPFVFAAGDCASIVGYPRPRSGVYAVRAGPPLGQNLIAALTDRRLRRYRPPSNALALLSAGEQYAVGAWGPVVFDGKWVWRWKDRIDRKFVRRFNPRA